LLTLRKCSKYLTMNQKILGAAILVTIAAAWYFIFKADERKLLFKAIPNSGIMVIEMNDARTLINNMYKLPVYHDLHQFDIVRKTASGFQLLDSLFWLPAKQHSSSLLASLHAAKADDYDIVFLFSPNALKQPLENIIDSLNGAGFVSQERILKGTTVYEIQLPGLSQPFTIAQEGKVVMAAVNPLLVDEAITQNHRFFSGYFTRFSSVNHTKLNSFNLYVRYANFSLLEPMFIHAGKKQNLLRFIANSFEDGSYQVSVQPDGIQIQGKTQLQDNTLLQHIVAHGSPATPNIGNILPYNTALLWYNRVNNIGKLVKSRNKQFLSLGSDWGWAGQEFALGYAEPSSASLSDVSFVAIACADSAAAVHTLQQYHAPNSKTEIYKGYTLSPVNAATLLSNLIGQAAAAPFKDAYYTQLKQYVLFAANKEQLQVLIENQVAGQVLQKNSSFTRFTTQINSDSYSFVYLLPNRFDPLVKATASPVFLNNYLKNNMYYKRFSPFVMQFGQGQGSSSMTTGIAIHYQNGQSNAQATEANAPATLLWNVELDHAPYGIPQVTLNHLTGEKELIVSDEKNNLYLISKNGRILWKRALNEPVLGKVKQIDMYSNGELYYLFNTQSHIYLIDRKGEDVQSFPIKLSASATHGLTLMDVEGDKNYHFFIPCSNKNIYGYHYSGRPLLGWSPRQYLANMAFELRYFSFEKETYLVATNTEGTIYLLAPDGSLIRKLVCGSPLIAPPQIDLRNGKPHIIATTKNSITHIFNLDGNKTAYEVVHISPTADFFTANINPATANEEFVFLSNNKVYVYSDKTKVFEFVFPDGNKPTRIFPVQLFGKPNKQVGVYCAGSNQIYLIDKKGNKHPNFPLLATTPFIVTDLIDNDSNILVAGGINKLVAYKLP